jgi:hypothetical protein
VNGDATISLEILRLCSLDKLVHKALEQGEKEKIIYNIIVCIKLVRTLKGINRQEQKLKLMSGHLTTQKK